MCGVAKKKKAMVATIIVALFQGGVAKKKKVVATIFSIAFFCGGVGDKKAMVIATGFTVFFAFLCGGAAMTKVMWPSSLCLREKKNNDSFHHLFQWLCCKKSDGNYRSLF